MCAASAVDHRGFISCSAVQVHRVVSVIEAHLVALDLVVVEDSLELVGCLEFLELVTIFASLSYLFSSLMNR